MPIIGITNIKGGVGKSTTSQILASFIAHNEFGSVILVDTNIGQGSSMRWSSYRDESLPSIPVVTMGDEKALTKNVLHQQDKYDYVIIDGTPKLESLTSRILLCSDLVICPVQASPDDIWGLEEFIERHTQAEAVKGEDIPLYVLLTRSHSTEKKKRRLETQAREVARELGLNMFETQINEREIYKEMKLEGRTGYESNNKKAVAECEAFGEEVMATIAKVFNS